MIRKILSLCLISGLAVVILNIKAYAYDNGDFQVWNTDVEEFKINKDAKIALEEEFRWGDNADEFYYHHYDIGLAYAFDKNLDLSFNYRHIYEKKKGKFRLENEPSLNATLKWDLWGCKFSDRHRLEYRHFAYQADSGRYRNTLTVRLPWKFSRFKIQPYLADEIFISFLGAAFNNNRLYSGLSFNLTEDFRADIYYLLQHSRVVNENSTNWPYVNVLGAKFRVSF